MKNIPQAIDEQDYCRQSIANRFTLYEELLSEWEFFAVVNNYLTHANSHDSQENKGHKIFASQIVI